MAKSNHEPTLKDVIDSIHELGERLNETIERTNSSIERTNASVGRTNEAVEKLAKLVAHQSTQTNERFDELIEAMSGHWRDHEARIKRLERKFG